MKKIVVLSTVLAVSLFATNGDNLIGLSAQTRALGGTGIAMFSGAGNALTNPALLAKTKSDKEFSFGGTVFSPDVKVSTSVGTSRKSADGVSVIPSVALLNRISDTTVLGLGMYGTAGMGTDWRAGDWTTPSNSPGLYNMRSALMLMQFAPSIAYGTDKFGVGLTAIIQYGTLSIDYDTVIPGDPPISKHVGDGTSNSFGYGVQIGGYYNVTKELTVGAIYKSKIDMSYKDQISKAAAGFGYGINPSGLPGFSDHLEQPAEIGVGLSYSMGNMTYTGDVRSIRWADAKGYKDFGWNNQTVYALGVKYKTPKYWLGAGFNYGKNPIPNNTDSTSVAGGANTNGDTLNVFNYVMFPAIVEQTYTIGGGMEISKGTMVSLAYTYAPTITTTVSGTTVGLGNVTTKHYQQALTFSLKYKF